MPSDSYQNLLEAGLKSQSIELSKKQIDQLLSYIDLLDKWNKVYNLTSIKDKKQMVILHLLDSLSVLNEIRQLAKQLSKQSAKELIIADVGTGGGLPGIPLSICLSDVKFTLIDARDKKIRFIQQVLSELKLKNVQAIHTRAENYQPDTKFDIVITRAFSSIKDMLSICSHLCHNDGLFLAMKGKQPLLEINEIPEQFKLLTMQTLNVYHLDASRHLLVLQANHNNE